MVATGCSGKVSGKQCKELKLAILSLQQQVLDVCALSPTPAQCPITPVQILLGYKFWSSGLAGQNFGLFGWLLQDALRAASECLNQGTKKA